MTFTVFISSSIRDNAIVEELKNSLWRYGIESVVSTDIPAGENVEQYVRQKIWSSDCFLAIIGKGSAQIGNVSFEMGIAVSQNKPVIPIVEEGSEIPPSIANRPYILIDKNEPRLSYERAATYLSRLKVEKEQRGAIGGLVLLGLGLLLLGALASSD